MTPRIIRRRDIPGEAGRLPGGMHPVIERILRARGVNDVSQLSLEMANMLRPNDLGGVDQAAAVLAEAVTGSRSILVVGDFDADGATGTALALLSLRAMGCKSVDFRVPNRFEFGYGLTVPLVQTLADDPPQVLVTVDSGISCVDGVRQARSLGCKVVVTDHHLPGDLIPEADAIVNPNCPGETFASKAMAGVGVIFYLLSVVRRELRDRNWFNRSRPEPNLAQFLDLVALGTVSDLVPLDYNNRVLVRQGLERIRRGLARPGLMALLRLGKRDYRYASASDLGFAVGPRLNAAGRLEDMSTGIRCLLTDDPSEARDLALQLDELNRQRRDMQDQMQQEAQSKVEDLLQSLEQNELPPALCLFDETWHQGIVGLVASRIKDKVHRPVLAFAPESEGASLLKGSARSVKGLHIRDVLAYVDSHHPGMIRAFGGHAMAAGLSLEKEAYRKFQQALPAAVAAVLGETVLSAEILTDGELDGEDISLDFARRLENLSPWGQRFPEPVFDGVFRVLDHRVLAGAHLKMIVQAVAGGEPVDAIAFNRLPEDLPLSGAVRLLYRLNINRWRGNESCQLMVEEIIK
ncbi:MAG: single-stranded-DNA-specific exonuclease RecJ [Xanthomonadales bacterium]|nr:single-stranded-DNA-specific exonuclease RecJ [Gammaproteobacteria bacterium]MBT8053180.1 single-stranded-DNA-specific exonuclease RecJ [Gammaproteobacteria bacterium]NND56088.1 single-stranded-DNA-specific exonuclease RecJ [Xanthomonadales bacterium]NNK50219.1 single-stranded-DNA-specific exonuclease RecJ [Xanthomonadales bacterium]